MVWVELCVQLPCPCWKFCSLNLYVFHLLSQPLCVYICNCPAVSGKYWFFVIFHCLSLLQSFHPLPQCHINLYHGTYSILLWKCFYVSYTLSSLEIELVMLRARAMAQWPRALVLQAGAPVLLLFLLLEGMKRPDKEQHKRRKVILHYWWTWRLYSSKHNMGPKFKSLAPTLKLDTPMYVSNPSAELGVSHKYIWEACYKPA